MCLCICECVGVHFFEAVGGDNKIILYNPGWPKIHYVHQKGLELIENGIFNSAI